MFTFDGIKRSVKREFGKSIWSINQFLHAKTPAIHYRKLESWYDDEIRDHIIRCWLNSTNQVKEKVVSMSKGKVSSTKINEWLRYRWSDRNATLDLIVFGRGATLVEKSLKNLKEESFFGKNSAIITINSTRPAAMKTKNVLLPHMN